jgi:hypothetical protein
MSVFTKLRLMSAAHKRSQPGTVNLLDDLRATQEQRAELALAHTAAPRPTYRACSAAVAVPTTTLPIYLLLDLGRII